MKIHLRNRILWIRLLLIFSLFAISIILSGIFIYKNKKNDLKNEISVELEGVAKKNVADIVSWIKERNSDADFVFHNELVKPYLFKFINHPKDLRLKKKITKWLKPIKDYHEYSDIVLLNNKGKIIYSYTNQYAPYDYQNAIKVLDDDTVSFSHLKLNPVTNKIYMDFRVPLVIHKNNKSINFGVLIFRIDPYSSFFKVVKSLPVPYLSAESYIVRRQGSNALVLSELKFKPNAPFAYKLPITKKENPAVKALLGASGIFEGNDYRNIPVLSDLSRVPGTPWFIITKVDQSEIYAPIQKASLIS